MRNYLKKGDFSQKDAIENNIIIGRMLPVCEVIFTASERKKINLHLWNESSKDVLVFVRTSNNILVNGKMYVPESSEIQMSFTVDLNEGDQLFAGSSEDGSISYIIE